MAMKMLKIVQITQVTSITVGPPYIKPICIVMHSEVTTAIVEKLKLKFMNELSVRPSTGFSSTLAAR